MNIESFIGALNRCVTLQICGHRIRFNYLSLEDLREQLTFNSTSATSLGGRAIREGLGFIEVVVESAMESADTVGMVILDFDSGRDSMSGIEIAADLSLESASLGAKYVGHGHTSWISNDYCPLPTIVITSHSKHSLRKHSGSPTVRARRQALERLGRYPWVDVIHWTEPKQIPGEQDSVRHPGTVDERIDEKTVAIERDRLRGILSRRATLTRRLRMALKRRENRKQTVDDSVGTLTLYQLRSALKRMVAWSELRSRIKVVLVDDTPSERIKPRPETVHPISLDDLPTGNRDETAEKVFEQAKAILQADPLSPGAILMDLNLDQLWDKPRTDSDAVDVPELFTGLDVMIQLRPVPAVSPDEYQARQRHNTLGDPPIIVLTGYKDKDHILRAMRAGADGYLDKKMSGPGDVDWQESLTRAFNTVFTLHARRASLQRYLFKIAFLFGDEVLKGEQEYAADQSVDRKKARSLRNELDQEFPIGSVPYFIERLYRAILTVLTILRSMPPGTNGEHLVDRRSDVREISRVLATVPPSQNPVEKRDLEFFSTLLDDKYTISKSPLDFLREHFRNEYNRLSREIEPHVSLRETEL